MPKTIILKNGDQVITKVAIKSQFRNPMFDRLRKNKRIREEKAKLAEAIRAANLGLRRTPSPTDIFDPSIQHTRYQNIYDREYINY